MATEIDKMTDEFRSDITKRGSVEVLGQHATYSRSAHAQSVAAYRLGLEAGRKLRGKSSAREPIDARTVAIDVMERNWGIADEGTLELLILAIEGERARLSQ